MRTTTIIVAAMDHNHEAFELLRTLDVISELPESPDWLFVNRNKLYMLGYCLIFDGYEPVFCELSSFHYMYNINIFVGSIIPRSTLKSFTFIQMKNAKLSP